MGEEAKKRIGKLKVGLIISVIVIVVLAASNIWFYLDKQWLELEIGELWDNYSDEQWLSSYYQNMSAQLSTEKANLQNQVSNLTYEKNTLQEQVNALTTERDDLQNKVNTLTSQVTTLQTQYGTLNVSYYKVLANITSLQTNLNNMTNWKNSLLAQIADLEDQIANLQAAKLVKVDVRWTDNRPVIGIPYVHLWGYIVNVGTNTAYNCTLRVVLYQGPVPVVDTYIILGTIAHESWKWVSENIYYSGEPLTSVSVTPIWD